MGPRASLDRQKTSSPLEFDPDNNGKYDTSKVWKYFPIFKKPQQSVLWESSCRWKSTLDFHVTADEMSVGLCVVSQM